MVSRDITTVPRGHVMVAPRDVHTPLRIPCPPLVLSPERLAKTTAHERGKKNDRRGSSGRTDRSERPPSSFPVSRPGTWDTLNVVYGWSSRGIVRGIRDKFVNFGVDWSNFGASNQKRQRALRSLGFQTWPATNERRIIRRTVCGCLEQRNKLALECLDL